MPKSYKTDVSSKSGMLSHSSFSLAPVLRSTFAIFFCSSFIFAYLHEIYTNSGGARTFRPPAVSPLESSSRPQSEIINLKTGVWPFGWSPLQTPAGGGSHQETFALASIIGQSSGSRSRTSAVDVRVGGARPPHRGVPSISRAESNKCD